MRGHDEQDWNRAFNMRRALEDFAAKAEFEQMMTRERSPHLATEPAKEGNRHQRRAQARRNRR